MVSPEDSTYLGALSAADNDTKTLALETLKLSLSGFFNESRNPTITIDSLGKFKVKFSATDLKENAGGATGVCDKLQNFLGVSVTRSGKSNGERKLIIPGAHVEKLAMSYMHAKNPMAMQTLNDQMATYLTPDGNGIMPQWKVDLKTGGLKIDFTTADIDTTQCSGARDIRDKINVLFKDIKAPEPEGNNRKLTIAPDKLGNITEICQVQQNIMDAAQESQQRIRAEEKQPAQHNRHNPASHKPGGVRL